MIRVRAESVVVPPLATQVTVARYTGRIAGIWNPDAPHVCVPPPLGTLTSTRQTGLFPESQRFDVARNFWEQDHSGGDMEAISGGLGHIEKIR